MQAKPFNDDLKYKEKIVIYMDFIPTFAAGEQFAQLRPCNQ